MSIALDSVQAPGFSPLAVLPLGDPGAVYLDLGSGPEPAAGYLGVDAMEDPPECVWFLNLCDGTPWPWEDGSVDGLRSSHFIEHIPRDHVVVGTAVAKTYRRSPGGELVKGQQVYNTTQDAFYWFFDQAFRVAKRGARFELSWPDPQHVSAYQDPTHCRFIPVAALNYLSKAGRRALRINLQTRAECDWCVESVTRLGTEEAMAPYATPVEADRHWNAAHEIRAILVKP